MIKLPSDVFFSFSLSIFIYLMLIKVTHANDKKNVERAQSPTFSSSRHSLPKGSGPVLHAKQLLFLLFLFFQASVFYHLIGLMGFLEKCLLMKSETYGFPFQRPPQVEEPTPELSRGRTPLLGCSASTTGQRLNRNVFLAALAADA